MTGHDSCPICGIRSLEMRKVETTIPHFGRALILTFICENCGYRHSETVPLEDHGPSKHIIKVRKADDLRIKIARSGTGSIEIPEFGLKLDPGSEGQPFITNVEGILARFEESLRRFEELGESNKSTECHKLLHKISLARQARLYFTIVIEDPFGNSAVIKEDSIQ